MAHTINTMPYNLQLAEGKEWREICWQDEAKAVSRHRKRENRRMRSRNRQLVREGKFDDCIVFVKNAKWLAS